MFNNSKYTRWYFRLVESIKTKNRDCFTETHHIIPKCFGGTNNPNNLVKLTPREHYICHRLLLEMVDTPKQKKKMAYALVGMGRTNAKDKTQKRISSKQYEKIRNCVRKYFTGKKNPFYGKGHFGKDNPMSNPKNYERFLKVVRSKEHSQMMSIKCTGEKNGFFGKKHSKKTKKILSEKRSQPIEVLFETGKTISFSRYGKLGTFLGKTTHLGAKLCSGNYNYLWKKYGIKEINYGKRKNSEEHSED